jgi:opacity protein-like surface antigen
MTRLGRVGGAVALAACTAAPARADVTAFIGANTTPSNRQVRGAALGFGLLIVGFEVEYGFTTDAPLASAPSLKTGMGNVILQTPVAIFGFQPYVTTGGGLYREELGSHSATGVGLNTGGGVKVSLAGPLRLRVDYRIFKLGSDALHSPAHRVYAGLNLKF